MDCVILCGRLSKEPELKYLSQKTDMAICRYTLAIDRGYGEKKKTIFVNCVAFGKAGEFANKYFRKGQRVLVQGELDISANEDKTKYYTTIIVNQQEFADGKKEGAVEKTEDVMNGFVDDNTEDDSIPF